MQNNKKCLILMTTYNGDKYLSQQLDSIINQTCLDWNLIIRDDGSSDGTIDLILDYMKRDDRVRFIRNDTSNHGAYLNFWTLIHIVREQYSDYEYYFFSDQDDVWESDKLDVMIKEAEKGNKDKPLLLYGDMRVIDEQGGITYASLNAVMGIGEMSGFSLFFTHGFLWGCDVCVNDKLFNSMPLIPLDYPHIDIMSHDNYMGKYALLTGDIKYIDKVLINHRRHRKNTTGGYAMQLSPMNVLRRGFAQFKDLSKTHAKVYNQTLAFIEEMSSQTNCLPESCVLMQQAIRKSGIRMITCMRKMRVRRKQRARTVGIYLIGCLGSYKKYICV